MKSVLGLIVPLPGEARFLLGRRGWRHAAGRPVRRIRLEDGTDLIGVRSGVGMENARSAARWLVSEGASALAVMGVAGGLDPEAKAGDLILVEEAIEDGEQTGSRTWTADCTFVDHVQKAFAGKGISFLRGRVVTPGEPVLTVEGKKNLFRQSRALAVDMETAAAARVAEEANLPFFALRAICDQADRTVPQSLYDALGEGGKVRPSVLCCQLLRRPRQIADLLRLRKEFSFALTALKRGWEIQLNNSLPGLLASGRPDCVRPVRRADSLLSGIRP